MLQARPYNRLGMEFSPPRDVSLSPKKRMYPDRNLHMISHNAIYHEPNPEDVPQMDSRN